MLVGWHRRSPTCSATSISIPTRCGPSTATSATSGCATDGNEQYVEVDGRVLALRRRPVRRAGLHARAAVRRRRGRDHRRRLRRPADGRPAARGGRRAHPHHREGRRLRRHLVLEPLPGRDVRRRVVRLPAAAGGARLHARSTSTPSRPEILEHSRSHRPALSTSTTTRCFQTGVTELRWDEDAARWIITHQPRRPHSRRSSSPWPTARCSRPKLPGIPGIDDFKGHTFHTSRWDYGYTGGDSTGGLTKPARQARRHHRHRRHRHPVHPAPRRVRPRSSTSSSARRRRSTCATTAETDPEWAATLEPGWQQRRHGQLQHRWSAAATPTRTWSHDGWTDIFRNLTGRGAPRRRRASSAAG